MWNVQCRGMSRLSHQSQHNAVVVCKELLSPNARCLPGGEYDVSSYLSPYRKCPFLIVAGIGKSLDSFFDGGESMCFAPRK